MILIMILIVSAGRALYDDIVRRINSGAITNPQPIVAVPAPANVPNLGVALFDTPAPAQLAPVATPSAGSIYTALAAQQEVAARAQQQLQFQRALEYEAFVEQEYIGRVEIPEHVEERGRFAAHESIASSFKQVQRKPNIVIGASNSRI